MRIVIVGGGIAAAYMANRIKKLASDVDILIVSDEAYSPYDRIHLCALVNKTETIENISLPVDPTVQIALNEKITSIDKQSKRVFSEHSAFTYDKLIIATGSIPQTLFDISTLKNAAVFRNADDCIKIAEGIGEREVVIVGSGPIGLELMDTLNKMANVKHITLLVRSDALYDKRLSPQAIRVMASSYLKSGKVTISYEDEIVDKVINEDEITLLKTKKLEIGDPFLIFGVGIKPNIDFARESLACDNGILTNNKMQTEDPDIYAVGEAAQVEAFNFIAGHVKECTLQADVAITSILGLEEEEFSLEVMICLLYTSDAADEYQRV